MSVVSEDFEGDRILELPSIVAREVQLDQLTRFQIISCHWVLLELLHVRDDTSKKGKNKREFSGGACYAVHDIEDNAIRRADRVLEWRHTETAAVKGQLAHRHFRCVFLTTPFCNATQQVSKKS